MSILFGIDIETTGLNAASDEIIEVGFVTWDTTPNRMLTCYSCLVGGVRLPEGIIHLTGITPLMRANQGHPLEAVLQAVVNASAGVDFIVAHNAAFEQSFLANNGHRDWVDRHKWIDTQTDLPYLPGAGGGSLSDIAMRHHVYNPMPHRAMPDALTMMQVLAMYPFAEVQRHALAPSVTLEIKFPYDPSGDLNAAVKALGYRWVKEQKSWRKTVKDFSIETEVASARAAGFSPSTLMAIGEPWEVR